MISSAILNFNDVIKVRMQTDQQLQLRQACTPKYTSYLGTGRTIAAEEGVSVLFFRGMTASMMREISYSTLRIGLYEPCKNLFAPNVEGDIGLLRKILAGATSGAIGSAIANPTDLVKIRFQAQPKPIYRNSFHALAEIFRAEGVAGLYKGVGPTMMRASVLTGAQLSSYDHAKHTILDYKLMPEDSFMTHLVAAVISGLVTTAASSPIDVIKTRVMTEVSRGAMFNGPVDCIVKSIKAEGVAVLYRGFMPNYMRIGPHFVMSFPLLEYLRNLFGVGYM